MTVPTTDTHEAQIIVQNLARQIIDKLDPVELAELWLNTSPDIPSDEVRHAVTAYRDFTYNHGV